MVRGIVTAGGGHPWETGVVAALAAPGAPLAVVRRCADMADVLAVASTGQLAACLIAADLRRLDSDTVHRLAMFGVRVIAVHRAGDARTATLLGRIGVADAIADDADPDAMIAVVVAAIDAAEPLAAGPGVAATVAGDPRSALPDPRPDPGLGLMPDAVAAPVPVHTPWRPDGTGGAAVTSDDGPAGAGGAARHRPAKRRRRERDAPAHTTTPAGDRTGGQNRAVESRFGRVLAVWGPVGAPGRSTVAMGLADRCAAAGDSVLLVDADVYGGILASAFGLLDESAGVAGACRLAAHGRLDDAELAALCWSIDDRLALLTGIARADRWPELRPSTIPMVLDIARARADLVVVDCAAILETDEEITFDTMAPRRNGATIAALRAADLVLAVGSADPPGMERLARGMAELAGAWPGAADADVRIVLNRVRPTAAAPAELAAATRRFCGREPEALLPEDRAACDLAWRRGVPVAQIAPGSRTRLPRPAGANIVIFVETADPGRELIIGAPGRACATMMT